MGAVLIWLAVVLVAFLLALLVTPLRLRATLRAAPRLSYRIEVRVFGGLSPAMVVADSTRPRTRKPKEPAQARRRHPRRRSVAGRGGRTRVLSALPRLVSGILGAIRLDYLSLDLEFGLADPADTGQLFGMLSPLKYGVSASKSVSVMLRPVFDGPYVAADLDTSLRMTPATLVWPLTRFGWSAFGPGR